MTQDKDSDFSYGPGQAYGQFRVHGDNPPPLRMSERRKAVWWMAGGVAVVVAVIVTVLVVRGGPSRTADAALEAGLLTGADVPDHTVTKLTQGELDQATEQDQQLPDDINPTERTQLLQEQPKLIGDTVGAAKLESGDTYYVEMIRPDTGIQSWDPAKASQVADTAAQ